MYNVINESFLFAVIRGFLCICQFMARILKEYTSVALGGEDLDGEMDFGRIFGRCAPVHIEVGSGRGTFLVNEAGAHPEVNLLGIEWARRYWRYAVDRVGRRRLSNVRLIRADVAVLISDNVADDSVDCFHIYFPDPWPKRRHHKRRFFNDTNMAQLLRCLKSGGCIRIATDHAEYFEQIQAVISARGDIVEPVDFLPSAGADTGEWVGTNFERKYLRQHRPIYALAVRKI